MQDVSIAAHIFAQASQLFRETQRVNLPEPLENRHQPIRALLIALRVENQRVRPQFLKR